MKETIGATTFLIKKFLSNLQTQNKFQKILYG